MPPRRAQRRTHPLVSVGVIGRGPQLQHRRTVFERSVRRDTENCCRPMAVALAENFGQLVRRPHIRQTLDTGSVCIQRGDEHRVAPQVVQLIFQIIRTIAGEGTTILLVEQNAHMALKVAKTAHVLETGHLVTSGAAAELARDDQIRKAYLGVH